MAAADQVQFDMGDEDCETEDEDGNRRPRRSTVRSAANRSSLCQNYEALDATTNKNFSMGDDDEDEEDDGGTSTAKRSSLVDRYGALESFAATGTSGKDMDSSGQGAKVEDVPSATSPQDLTDGDVEKRDEGGEPQQAKATEFNMMEDECDTEDEDGNRRPRRSTISAAQRSSLCQHYEALEGASKHSFSMADGDEEEVGNAAAQRSSICARYAAMSDFNAQQDAPQSENGAESTKPESDPTVSGAPCEAEEAVETKTVTFCEPSEETAQQASSVAATADKEPSVVPAEAVAASTDAVQECTENAPEAPSAVSAASMDEAVDSGSKVLSAAPQQESSTGEPRQEAVQFDMMEDECDTEDEDGNRRTRRSTISAAQRSSLCQHYEALEGASKQSFSMGDGDEEEVGNTAAQRSSICARYAALSDFAVQQSGDGTVSADSELDAAESKAPCEAVETAASQDTAPAVQACSDDATSKGSTAPAEKAASKDAVQEESREVPLPGVETQEQQEATQDSERGAAANIAAEEAPGAPEDTKEVTSFEASVAEEKGTANDAAVASQDMGAPDEQAVDAVPAEPEAVPGDASVQEAESHDAGRKAPEVPAPCVEATAEAPSVDAAPVEPTAAESHNTGGKAPEAPAPSVEATTNVEKSPVAPAASKPAENTAADSASIQAAERSAAPTQQPPPLLRCCLL